MKSATPRRPYELRARAQSAAATGERILEAAIARFATEPYEDVSLDAVAADAGVSTRTVIRRFGSKDELFVAADRLAGRRMLAQRDQAPVGDARAAVSIVVEHYEEWGDQRLLMLAQEHRIPAIREHTQAGRGYHRAWVERTFAPQLDAVPARERERRVLALVAATDVYVWKLLRRDLGLSAAETLRVMETLVSSATGGH